MWENIAQSQRNNPAQDFLRSGFLHTQWWNQLHVDITSSNIHPRHGGQSCLPNAVNNFVVIDLPKSMQENPTSSNHAIIADDLTIILSLKGIIYYFTVTMSSKEEWENSPLENNLDLWEPYLGPTIRQIPDSRRVNDWPCRQHYAQQQEGKIHLV